MFLVIGSAWLILLAVIFGNLSIFVIGFCGLALNYFFMRKYDKNDFLRIVSTVAISIGFCAMFLLYLGLQIKYGRPYYLGGSDDLQFEITANQLIRERVFFPEQMSIKYSGHNSKGFVCFLANFMRLCNIVGGYHTATFRIFNIEMLILLSILVFRLADLRTGNKIVAKKLFIFMTFFPNCIYISSFVFRDTINMVILFASVLVWYEFIRTRKIAHVILESMILAYCLFWFRSQNIIIVIALVLCFVLFDQYKFSKKKILFGALLVFIFIIFAMQTDLLKSVIDTSRRYTENYLSYSNNGFSKVIFSLPLFPFGVFARMTYAIISPIPTSILQIVTSFDINSIANFFVSCGTIYQIYQLPYLARGAKKFNSITMCFLIMWFVVASTTFTFRHFLMIYPFMAYLIIEQKEEVRKNYAPLITIGIAFLGFIYILMGL